VVQATKIKEENSKGMEEDDAKDSEASSDSFSAVAVAVAEATAAPQQPRYDDADGGGGGGGEHAPANAASSARLDDDAQAKHRCDARNTNLAENEDVNVNGDAQGVRSHCRRPAS